MKRINVQKAEKSLTALMEQSVCDKHTLGGIAIVHQEGVPILKAAVGKASVNGKEITEKTIFRLASMSKNICSIALMQMVDRGLLGLDTKLSDFYPGFREKWVAKRLADGTAVPDYRSKEELTIRHLATHTAGIGTEQLVPPFEASDDFTLEKIAGYYADEALLDFEPGKRWGYSGLAGCDILGNIIEKVSDMPYEEYVRKHITEPLGMEDTGFLMGEEQWNRMADVLAHDENGNNMASKTEKRRLLGMIPCDYIAPGGGMASTAADYIKISDMLVNEGSYDGIRILSPEAVRQIRKPLIPQGMPGIFFPWMTFGVCVYVRIGLGYIPDGSFGWGGAYGTYTWVDPQNKLGVVWMKNSNVLASIIEPTGEKAFEKAIYDAME